MERAAVQQRTHGRVRTPLGEDVELLFRPLVGPGEAEQLEQKDPPLRVAGLVPQLGAQRLDGLVQPAGSKQFLRVHAAFRVALRPTRASDPTLRPQGCPWTRPPSAACR